MGVLGTAATATFLRRAVKGATAERPDLQELQELKIVRDGLHYRYVLPSTWNEGREGELHALRYLVEQQLCPLLAELTGPVVVHLLQRQPELRAHRIVATEENTDSWNS